MSHADSSFRFLASVGTFLRFVPCPKHLVDNVLLAMFAVVVKGYLATMIMSSSELEMIIAES